ncbi:uncharacterized protein LOC131436620 isoform X2 [Malaya genurostris]|uniref:uncharacterized protein LOC131436620 isoform X2 n=1 Tax=Malaya genurostris TaxID=325434 RepID=UPI0026F3F941|nr:uncharacterized protein LOC131436620 isoform X2 [Malaya genurostris]
MSSKGKRSSILKKRPSVGPGSLEASPTETTTALKTAKRIGFKPKKSVKEFIASDDTATIWCNSYELSADGTPIHMSINDTISKNISRSDISQFGPNECDSKNKENVEDRRISPNNSSIWNLSVSACEEERRRMRGEISVNSSVLNVTDRLFLEPTLHSRPVLRQKQADQTLADSIAMDVSPVKCDGKMNSPRKTIYYHPKQNMFVSIDDVPTQNQNSSKDNRSPNDTDLNFFGPSAAGLSSTSNVEPSKILFQTSNVSNPWRNKSNQTGSRSALVNQQTADLSQRLTFGNSNPDISEAWNSHPAAALKLRLMQQGLTSMKYDSRFSDEGGGGGVGVGEEEDIDSTIAITQTVAKILGPGSRPVSLESSRVSEVNNPEPMETSLIISDDQQPRSEGTVVGEVPLSEESLCDVLVPLNGLSRARPSFVPSSRQMDDSKYLSPGKNQRIAETSKLNVSDMQLDLPSPTRNSPNLNRRTIMYEKEIPTEDQEHLTIPKAVTQTPPRPPVRQTVYEAKMDESPKKIEKHPPLVPIEKINMDVSELVFGRNSIGLELVTGLETKQEANRPKIHRMSLRTLNHDFGFAKPQNDKNSSNRGDTICLDSPEKQAPLKSDLRKTTIHPLDVSLDVEAKSDDGKSQKQQRQTIYPQEVIDLTRVELEQSQRSERRTDHRALDVSTQSPAGGQMQNVAMKRTTILTSEAMNHTTSIQLNEKPGRSAVLLDENLDISKPESRSCLNDNVKNIVKSQDKQRQTIYPQEAIEVMSEGTDFQQPPTRRTDYHSLDVCMQSPAEEPEHAAARRTTILTREDINQIGSEPILRKALRPTMLFNENLECTKLEPRSGTLDYAMETETRQGNQEKHRQTIYPREVIDLTGTETEPLPKPVRLTDCQLMDVSTQGPTGGPVHTVAKTRSTILTNEDINQSALEPMAQQPVRPTILFNEKLVHSKLEPRSGSLEDLRNYGNARRTIVDVDMDCTVNDSYGEKQSKEDFKKSIALMEETKRSSLDGKECDKNLRSRLTTAAPQSMDETTDLGENISTDRRQRKITIFGSEIDESRKEPSPAAKVVAKQTLRQTINSRESMDQTVVGKLNDEVMKQSPRPEKSSSRNTIINCEQMDETRCQSPKATSVIVSRMKNCNETVPNVRHIENAGVERKITANQPRQSCFQVEDMNRSTTPTNCRRLEQDNKQPRLTVFNPVDMDETFTSGYGLSKPMQMENMKERSTDKPRQTSFAVENMDATIGIGDCQQFDRPHQPTIHEEPLQNCRQTIFQHADMDQTLASDFQPLSLITEPILSKHGTLSPSKSFKSSTRSTVFQPADMEQTTSENAVQKRCVSPRQSHNKSCQTSYIDGPTDKSFAYRSAVGQSMKSKSRQTVYEPQELDETLLLRKSVLNSKELLPRSDQHPIFQMRGTILPGDAIDESCSPSLKPKQNTPVTNPVNVVPSSKNRHTILATDAMEETTVDVQKYCMDSNKAFVLTTNEKMRKSSMEDTKHTVGQSELQLSTRTKSRQTVYCEDDMDQTTTGHGFRSALTEVKPTGLIIDEKACENKKMSSLHARGSLQLMENDVQLEFASSTQKQPEKALFKKNRQTILGPQSMESSLVNSMEVSVIQSPMKSTQLPRRTIVQVDDIMEESFNRDFQSEQADSAVDLPDDCVLRSAAVMPSYRMSNFANQTFKSATHSVKPDNNSPAFTNIPGTARRTVGDPVTVHELSEISGLGDITRLTRPTSFAVTEDVCSFVLKELTEPSFIQPPTAAAVSVIQETPKKAGTVPVRRSRGTIFDRQSMDLDESGILPIAVDDRGDGESSENKQISKATSPSCIEIEPPIVRLVDPDYESSDDEEFYDAEANQEDLNDNDGEKTISHSVHESNVQNSNGTARETLNLVEVENDEPSIVTAPNRTVGGCKTINFIDINELDLTAQKRHLSRISKSVLIDQKNDPLNFSLTDDYPMKKRKTSEPVSADENGVRRSDEPRGESRKSTRRVTFLQDVTQSIKNEDDTRLSTEYDPISAEVESVTIKNERMTMVEKVCNAEQSYFGHTLLTDPSVFIVEDNDMLANESNLSLVTSLNAQNSNGSNSLKLSNSYYNEFAHLTLNGDQEGSSCIIISDDSLTVPTTVKSSPVEAKLTLVDLPKRIKKTRASMEFNSTVASEVMYELRRQVSGAQQSCCSFEGNCDCGNRRTMFEVRKDNVIRLRECWKRNFEHLLESSVSQPVHDMPLNERLHEILNRPVNTLPLVCLEQQGAHLPETPSIWFLLENYKKSVTFPVVPVKVFNPSDLPRTPNVTSLISNKLETERYRWFLDSTSENRTCLKLRHCVLRSICFKILLQKSLPWYSEGDDVRIESIEYIHCSEKLVHSSRLLLAHIEFKIIVDSINLIHLSSHCSSVAHLMSLVTELDVLVEQAFGKVDQLYRIVRNNGAIIEQMRNTARLRIFKVFEYERNGVIFWNRVSVQFDSVDRIDRSSVSFHKNTDSEEKLFPTEHQCGRAGVRGLVFLECLLWNIEKLSIE